MLSTKPAERRVVVRSRDQAFQKIVRAYADVGLAALEGSFQPLRLVFCTEHGQTLETLTIDSYAAALAMARYLDTEAPLHFLNSGLPRALSFMLWESQTPKLRQVNETYWAGVPDFFVWRRIDEDRYLLEAHKRFTGKIAGWEPFEITEEERRELLGRGLLRKWKAYYKPNPSEGTVQLWFNVGLLAGPKRGPYETLVLLALCQNELRWRGKEAKTET